MFYEALTVLTPAEQTCLHKDHVYACRRYRAQMKYALYTNKKKKSMGLEFDSAAIRGRVYRAGSARPL